MAKIYFTILILLISKLGFSQFTYKIKADTLLVTNDTCNAELILKNATRNVDGFLYNTGSGKTAFKKVLTKLSANKYLYEGDTLSLNATSLSSYATMTQVNETTYTINKPDGTKDTVMIDIGSFSRGTVNTGQANQLAFYNTAGTIASPLPSITASRALVSDANGLPVASGATATEVSYVSGVTSPVQTQLNTKASLTGTETLTNKRFNPRIQSITSSGTVTPNADNDDAVVITAQAGTLTLTAPSGTPVQGQVLIIRIKDNGSSRTIGFDQVYRPVGITKPASTTASKTMYICCVYNSSDSKWDIVAVNQEL